MLTTTRRGTLVFIIAVVLAATVRAEVALGLKGGSLGIGADLTFPLVPDQLNARVNGNYFSYSTDQTYSNVDYDAKLKLNSLGVLIDWHAFSGKFRFSAGAYHNANKVTVNGKPSAGSTYDFNGSTYTSAQVGSLRGSADFNKFSPYLGIGGGNALAKNSRWTFVWDLGVLFSGAPKLGLSSTGGTLSSDPTFQANFESERRSAEDDANVANVWPVFAFGVAYKF
jgi:hypothetical protein